MYQIKRRKSLSAAVAGVLIRGTFNFTLRIGRFPRRGVGQEAGRGAEPSEAESTRAESERDRGRGGGGGAEGVASAGGRGWAMTSRKMQQGAAMQGDEANWAELGQWVSGSHLRFDERLSTPRSALAISRHPHGKPVHDQRDTGKRNCARAIFENSPS